MQLNEGVITPVEYTDTKGVQSDRVILPTSVPSTNVKAIDLTDASVQERETTTKLYKEYQEYRDMRLASILTFEEWIDHSGKPAINPKWRTFNVNRLS